MKNKNKIDKNIHQFVWIFIGFLIILSIVVFVILYSGTHKKNIIINSPVSKTALNEKSLPQKNNDTIPQTTTQNQTSISIILNAAAQDTIGGALIIRAQLVGLTGGSCDIGLIKGTNVLNFTSPIQWEGSFYSCSQDIPYSSLENGTWALTLKATQDNFSKTVYKEILIK